MHKKIEGLLEKKKISFSVIGLLALIIYSGSFTSPFILDDFGSIDNNYSIRNPLNIISMWNFYSNRIVLYFTLAINYFIHENDVIGYHIVNLGIHIFNGILVFFILKNLLGLRHFSDKVTGRYRNIISMLSALIFICHPVQVNAVTYIIQRTASLAALFYLLAVYFYIRFRITDKIRYFFFTLISILFAMFTKENTITIPFMLLLIELMFFLKDGKTPWYKRITFLSIIFMTVPIIPGTNLFLHGHSQSDPNVNFKASTSMNNLHYFYTELKVIVTYIRQLFIPDNLNFDYSNDYTISKSLLTKPLWNNASFVSLIILAAIGLEAIIKVKKNKLFSFGIFWFFLGLSIESSFISIKDVYFEHRLYFPIIGFIISIVGIVFSGKSIRGRTHYFIKKPLLYFIILSCTMIFTYSIVTIQRNYVFSSSIRLWTDVVKKAPGSDRAHCSLATNHMNKYDSKHNSNPHHLDIAEREFLKAIEINYWNDVAHTNLARVYYYKKEYEKSIEQSFITNRHHSSKYAYYNLALVYKKTGEIDKALSALQAGYRLDKKCTFILKMLGDVYNTKKEYSEAKKYYEEFLEHNGRFFSDNGEIRDKLKKVNEKLKTKAK